MGGPSSEHEVSLQSGEQVLLNLNKNKYTAEPVLIDKRGMWLFKKFSHLLPEPQAALFLQREKYDLAFLALHGEYGEDGKVQRLLKAAGLPFTGSGVLASALAMNKFLSLQILKSRGLVVPPQVHFSKSEWNKNSGKIIGAILGFLGLPAVVKPNNRGSSVGVKIVKAGNNPPREIRSAVEEVLSFSPDLVVQKYIGGREFTCAILDIEGRATSLAPTEIIPRSADFFDYKEKYSEAGADEITPPQNLSNEILAEIQYAALVAHEALGCKHMSRADMILSKNDGKLYILELNTIPGMTATSLLPKAAKVAGIDYSRMLDYIIEASLLNHET